MELVDNDGTDIEDGVMHLLYPLQNYCLIVWLAHLDDENICTAVFDSVTVALALERKTPLLLLPVGPWSQEWHYGDQEGKIRQKSFDCSV